MATALAYCDYVFGNESEAAAFGEKHGWGTDISTVALKLAGKRLRIVPSLRICLFEFVDRDEACRADVPTRIKYFPLVQFSFERLQTTRKVLSFAESGLNRQKNCLLMGTSVRYS